LARCRVRDTFKVATISGSRFASRAIVKTSFYERSPSTGKAVVTLSMAHHAPKVTLITNFWGEDACRFGGLGISFWQWDRD
jgi:hypothetical protein